MADSWFQAQIAMLNGGRWLSPRAVREALFEHGDSHRPPLSEALFEHGGSNPPPLIVAQSEC